MIGVTRQPSLKKDQVTVPTMELLYSYQLYRSHAGHSALASLQGKGVSYYSAGGGGGGGGRGGRWGRGEHRRRALYHIIIT